MRCFGILVNQKFLFPEKTFCIPKKFLYRKNNFLVSQKILFVSQNKHHLRGTLHPPKSILYPKKSGTHSKWPRGMCRERTFTVKVAGGFAHIYLKDMSKRASWPDFAEACTGRDAASIWKDTWSDVLKESSMKVGTACPAFFCSCDGDLKGLCHGDDFCVIARQKQLQTFWKSP